MERERRVRGHRLAALPLYLDGMLHTCRVSDLANVALAKIEMAAGDLSIDGRKKFYYRFLHLDVLFAQGRGLFLRIGRIPISSLKQAFPIPNNGNIWTIFLINLNKSQ